MLKRTNAKCCVFKMKMFTKLVVLLSLAAVSQSLQVQGVAEKILFNNCLVDIVSSVTTLTFVMDAIIY